MADQKDTKPRIGGRPRVGTLLKTRDGRLQGQVTLGDGSRSRLKPFPKGTSRAMAKEHTAYQAAIAATVFPKKAKGEAAQELPDTPMGRWAKAWLADRTARGYSSVRDNTAHYLRHIAPSVGPKHVRDWDRDDFRKLSRDLDIKVQAKELAWKSAINVWATATKMAGDAAESKQDAIRCRADNPATGVRGPDRGDDVGEQYLYPSEFLKFVECEKVPSRWRRIVALAIYLYPRDAEIRAMQCRDVDIEHRSTRITKALSKRTGEVKATKGRRHRTVTIEEAVIPLLETIKAERDDEGALVPDMPSERDMARGLRRWLAKAGIDRHELHHRTPTTRPIRFHDLRATGITWMAIRGDDPLKIQHRAGHTDFETTQRYIRMAEAVREGFGVVFPHLPGALVSHASNAHGVVTQRNTIGKLRGGRDSNPRPPA
jgi:integrase